MYGFGGVGMRSDLWIAFLAAWVLPTNGCSSEHPDADDGGAGAGHVGSGASGGSTSASASGASAASGSGGAAASASGVAESASATTGGAGGATGAGGVGEGGALDCPATGTAYCTTIDGSDARCYPDGQAVLCPNDLPICWELMNGELTCVPWRSEPCDPESYETHCSGDTIMTCQGLGDGRGATWPTECGPARACLNPDTGEFDVRGPCKCAELNGASSAAVCVPVSAQPCDVATSPRSCVGSTLHYCNVGITAEHDCGADMVCQASNGTAGCMAPGATLCSTEIPPCFSSTVAQICCDPMNDVTCLPGYLTLQDCVAEFNGGECDSFWHNCVP
jgi:hypothetical protein